MYSVWAFMSERKLNWRLNSYSFNIIFYFAYATSYPPVYPYPQYYPNFGHRNRKPPCIIWKVTVTRNKLKTNENNWYGKTCTECFLLACADAIKSLSCVEFNLGGLHEKVWCALYIHKIDIKVVRWMSLEYDWWKGDTFDRCTCIYRFVNGFSFE